MRREAHRERFFTYRLFDRRDDSTHYIGITRNALALRLAQHLLCDGSNPDRDVWVQEVGPHNVGIEEIDVTIGWDEARRKEAYWIHRHLDEQAPLTNIIIPSLNGKGFTRVKSQRASIVPVKSTRRPDFKYWATGLPKGREVLEDLDAFCEEMGNIPRGESTRFILIAWSKARRGRFQQMWGFASGASSQVSVSMDPSAPLAKEAAKRSRNGNGAVAAQALDLD